MNESLIVIAWIAAGAAVICSFIRAVASRNVNPSNQVAMEALVVVRDCFCKALTEMAATKAITGDPISSRIYAQGMARSFLPDPPVWHGSPAVPESHDVSNDELDALRLQDSPTIGDPNAPEFEPVGP